MFLYSGRYHLYVSLACPWAHRTLIFRALKGLEAHVSVDVVHPFMGEDGWTFGTDVAGATGDRLMGNSFLREVYIAADPQATGRVTVPILWDKERRTIVSNEFRRDHPDVQLGLRRADRQSDRLPSGGTCRRNRSLERTD